MIEKTSLDKNVAIIGSAITAGLGGLTIYDALRARGHGEAMKKIQEALQKGETVESREFVKKIDPLIKVIWNEDDIRQALIDEGINKFLAKVMSKQIANEVGKGLNAAAFSGKKNQYIFARQRTNAAILGHEIGHILDFKTRGLTWDKQGPYEPNLFTDIWKPSHDKRVMTAEREAWRLAPNRDGETELERAALTTYDKAFHGGRAMTAGALAAISAYATLHASGALK